MPDDPRPIAKVAAVVRRWLLPWLAIAYVLAGFAPAAGLWLRDLSYGDWGPGGEPARFSLWMVAVLLINGAVMSDPRRLRELMTRPGALVLGLSASWIAPLALVFVVTPFLRAFLSTNDAAAVSLGLALAAAMPVANSAVAWTHQSDGSIPWALGLVIVSIGLCPWVAPLLLGLMGMTLSAAQAAAAEVVVVRATGYVFLVWVLAPTAVGLVAGQLLGPAGRRHVGPWLAVVSAAALLLLNYANASAALPQIVADPKADPIFAALLSAATLPIVGALSGWALAPRVSLSHRARVAWAYSLGMKNTGLALGLAGALLGDAPFAVLVILLVTLLQHGVAGFVHSVGARSPHVADTAAG
ncbi:MAG: bile acid:sodium symporter [Planctomycetota bacterium]